MKIRILFSLFVTCLCACILLLPLQCGQAEAAQPVAQSFDEAFTLDVLHDGGIIHLSLREYLIGVVSAELPQDFPAEALKSQAVAARTFALKSCKHNNADVCTDSACCQAWSADASEKAREAVVQTDGLVVTYGDALIEATYFSCSGGRTEPAAAVWGGDVPYLQSVESPGEESAPRFSETVEIEADLFAARLQAVYPEICLIGDAPNWFGQIRYSAGGGVESVVLGGVEISGTSLRGLFALRSTNMRFAVTQERICITTYGFGHRVGMSQYGAKAMAETGADFVQILTHYYQNCEIQRLFHTDTQR